MYCRLNIFKHKIIRGIYVLMHEHLLMQNQIFNLIALFTLPGLFLCFVLNIFFHQYHAGRSEDEKGQSKPHMQMYNKLMCR